MKLSERELKKIAETIVRNSVVVNFPPEKVGAIVKMNIDSDKLAQLKPKHFNHRIYEYTEETKNNQK